MSQDPLDHGRLRRRVMAGDPTLGVFVGSASAVTGEVCAAAGADWLLLDLEHGAGGEEQVRGLVPAAAAYGVPTLVRVESAARIRSGRVLELGAAGVMLPRLDRAAGDILGVVQIESAAAVAQAGEIAALDGADVLFVGPRDLSHDLGVPGDVTAPSFTAALDQVRRAAREHGKACGLLVADGAAAATRQAEGWTFVAIGSDTTLLATAVASNLARARAWAGLNGKKEHA